VINSQATSVTSLTPHLITRVPNALADAALEVPLTLLARADELIK
jgi:hypothetical protein